MIARVLNYSETQTKTVNKFKKKKKKTILNPNCLDFSLEIMSKFLIVI